MGHVVVINAIASDNVAVVSVRFFIDGQFLSEDFTAPYQASWSAGGLQDGSDHTIRAEARDPSGNLAFHEIIVTVDNSKT